MEHGIVIMHHLGYMKQRTGLDRLAIIEVCGLLSLMATLIQDFIMGMVEIKGMDLVQ